MATARKTASAAEQMKVSQIGDFRSRMRATLELPSGLFVKVKNPGGLTAFIANGTIPNSLLQVVQSALNEGSKEDAVKQAATLAKDVESMNDMMRLLDIVAVNVIKEPAVQLAPTPDDVKRHNLLFPENQVEDPDDLRDEDKYLYTDEIEDLDKQFLFQWVTGGTKDLEKFRQQQESNVAALSAVHEAEAGTKPRNGADAG